MKEPHRTGRDRGTTSKKSTGAPGAAGRRHGTAKQTTARRQSAAREAPTAGSEAVTARLTRQVSFEKLIADLSSKFINLSPRDVDNAIEDAQRRVCEFLDLDLSGLWQYSPETPHALMLTHLFRPLGGPPPPAGIDAREVFPWCLQELVAGRIVSVSTESAPEEAAQDKKTWRHYGIKTSLTFPLSAGKQPLFGALSFNDMRKDRAWTEPVVEGLQLVAEIFANALARKRSDEALRESEARLASAVDIARLGFYEETRGHRVSFLDDRVRGLLAIPQGQEHLTLDTWAKRLDPRDRDRVLRCRSQILNGEAPPVAEEYRYRHPERGLLWLHHALNVVERNDAGQPVRWVGVLRDITERKKVEEELTGLRLHSWHAERVAQIGAITASLAHELNQPLAAILTNAQAGLRFMDRRDFDVEEIRAILTDIVHDDKRAAAVISGLRAMLRRSKTPRETISLAESIRTVLILLHSEILAQQVEPHLRLEPDCRVSADKAQIQQVLINLVMNALQAMQDEPVAQRNLEMTLTQTTAGEAMLAVRDSGRGIPEEMRASVFEAFWTTKQEGLGIGLAICRSIVESHGGRLWFTANPDGGTTFHLALPLALDRDASGHRKE